MTIYQFGFPSKLAAIHFPTIGFGALIYQLFWTGENQAISKSVLAPTLTIPEARIKIPMSIGPNNKGSISATKPWTKTEPHRTQGYRTTFLGYSYSDTSPTSTDHPINAYRWVSVTVFDNGVQSWVDTGMNGPVYDDGHFTSSLPGTYPTETAFWTALYKSHFPSATTPPAVLVQNLGSVAGASAPAKTIYNTWANFLLMFKLGSIRAQAKGADSLHFNFETGDGPSNPSNTVDPGFIWTAQFNSYTDRNVSFSSFRVDSQNKPVAIPSPSFSAVEESPVMQPVPSRKLSFRVDFPRLEVSGFAA